MTVVITVVIIVAEFNTNWSSCAIFDIMQMGVRGLAASG